MKTQRLQSVMIDLFVFLLGFISLLAPFLFNEASYPGFSQSTFPIIVSLIILLCLMIIIFEAQSSFMDSKMIALLGVLIAINAGLRFLENAIPGPAGFSPIFFLVILVGYCFSSRVGFLMGAMTMLVSAMITGGVGPWLPGQMITAGWLGQSSAILRSLIDTLGLNDKPLEVVILASFSALWGIVYGFIMNLWFWPFLSASPGQSWMQSTNFVENLQGYLAYYLTTSFVWDVTRAIGNVIIISIMTRPVIKILDRFIQRFTFRHNEVIQG